LSSLWSEIPHSSSFRSNGGLEHKVERERIGQIVIAIAGGLDVILLEHVPELFLSEGISLPLRK
jgi:hypothetical protein